MTKTIVAALRKLFIIFLVLCHTACWDKQENDILLPNIPNYTLSGYTMDMDDTTQILPLTPVHLSAKVVLYDTTFTPVSTISDSNGYYQIDTVFPGIYIISAERGGFNIIGKQFDMLHENKSYDLMLPKPLFSETYYPIPLGGSNPRLTWGHDGLRMLGVFKTNADLPQYISVIYRCTFNGGIIGWDNKYSNPFPSSSCLKFINGFYYLQFNGAIAILPSTDLSFVSYIDLDDPLYGLAWDESGFWSTYKNYLQYRGQSISSVISTWKVNSGWLTSLNIYNDYFWVYDRDNDLLLEIDQQGNILSHFRPVYVYSGVGIAVYDMDFFSGELWISDKYGGIYSVTINQKTEVGDYLK